VNPRNLSLLLVGSLLGAALPVACGGSITGSRGEGSDAMAEGSDAAFVDATAQGSDGAFVDADGGQYEDLDAVADADVARNVSSVPLSHRATAVACPTVRRAGTVTAQCLDRGTFSVDPCRSDTDCEAGVNGRCDCMFPEAGYVGCTYDQCVTDTDCDGGVCGCSLAGNTCVPDLCRILRPHRRGLRPQCHLLVSPAH
jgi:hypothetical protein